ncbi:MAG: hydroxymethylbilane synthase [Acidimicrobiia bacterium]
MTRGLRVATRGSALARWQAARVVEMLDQPAELVVVSTRGDRDTASTIHALGGTGVFVKEVQDAVLRGDADVAVHSAKDLPPRDPEGLVLAAIPERGDPRDALVGSRLADLPTGARVGTGSVRRRAQLAALRSDLTFGELRGNIPTRLERAAAYDAVVVAAAALDRLGLAERVTERLEPSTLLPQVGQGGLAVECRSDDAETLAALTAIDDAGPHAEIRAERAFLDQLGGGCSLPCGALARSQPDGTLVLDVLLASLDGRIVLRTSGRGPDPEPLGVEVARELLDEQGGRVVLEVESVDAPGSAGEPRSAG